MCNKNVENWGKEVSFLAFAYDTSLLLSYDDFYSNTLHNTLSENLYLPYKTKTNTRSFLEDGLRIEDQGLRTDD